MLKRYIAKKVINKIKRDLSKTIVRKEKEYGAVLKKAAREVSKEAVRRFNDVDLPIKVSLR